VVVFEEWDWDLALLVCLDILGIFILGHPHLVLLIQNCKIRLLIWIVMCSNMMLFALDCHDKVVNVVVLNIIGHY